MKSVVMLFIAAASCFTGALAATDQPTVRRVVPPPPALPVPASSVPATRPTLAVAEKETIVTERDPAVVFQRAFWRRPTAADSMLHAERREWRDGTQGVQHWEWCIALEPSPALRAWLLVDNPFEVMPVAKADEAVLSSPLPDWFPNGAARVTLKQFRTQGSNLTLYLDEAHGRLYATDHGAGFTAGKP